MKDSGIFRMVREGMTLPASLGVIDAHAHFGRFNFCIPDLSLEGFARALDRIGVTEAWCSHMQCMSRDCHAGNDELIRAARAYPGKFRGMASFWPDSAESVRKEAERCFNSGAFIGIKLHNMAGFRYDHNSFIPAYAAANERSMPILFHTWGQEDVFGQIAKIAGKFPGLSILLAHAGSANTDGYIRMAREHENVHLDLSLSLCPRGLIEKLVSGCGAQKIVFGSDIYFLDLAQQLGRIAGADLAEEDKKAILGGNARRIRDRVQM